MVPVGLRFQCNNLPHHPQRNASETTVIEMLGKRGGIRIIEGMTLERISYAEARTSNRSRKYNLATMFVILDKPHRHWVLLQAPPQI
jgi:hypothetical protein